MGDVLFSLTADGSAAARARELAGVPLMAADLRKKWCVLEIRAVYNDTVASISRHGSNSIREGLFLITYEETLRVKGESQRERSTEVAIGISGF